MEKEITLIALKDNNKIIYKVTKRIPNLNVAETKIFNNKEEAINQFNEWSAN